MRHILLVMIIMISASYSFAQKSMEKAKVYEVKIFIKKVEKSTKKNIKKYFDALQKGDTTNNEDSISKKIEKDVVDFLEVAHNYRAKKLKKFGYERNVVIKFKSREYPTVADAATKAFSLLEKDIFTGTIKIENEEIPLDDLEEIAEPIVQKILEEIGNKENIFKNNKEK